MNSDINSIYINLPSYPYRKEKISQDGTEYYEKQKDIWRSPTVEEGSGQSFLLIKIYETYTIKYI